MEPKYIPRMDHHPLTFLATTHSDIKHVNEIRLTRNVEIVEIV